MMKDPVVIYAGDGGCYWAENACGYVRAEYAGVYEREDAIALTKHCGTEKRIELHPVPVDHIPTLRAEVASLRAKIEKAREAHRWARKHDWDAMAAHSDLRKALEGEEKP